MSKITGKAKDFLFKYLSNASPTGFESPGQKIWSDYIKPYVDEIHVDNYGTCYGVINPGQDYKVVIEAHADEISWFVNYISEDGFISVIRNGGSDHVIAPSKRVNIHTKKGVVQGVLAGLQFIPGRQKIQRTIQRLQIFLLTWEQRKRKMCSKWGSTSVA